MDVKNNKEDTEDNKAVVVDMLDGDNNTVNVTEDGGVKSSTPSSSSQKTSTIRRK